MGVFQQSIEMIFTFKKGHPVSPVEISRGQDTERLPRWLTAVLSSRKGNAFVIILGVYLLSRNVSRNRHSCEVRDPDCLLPLLTSSTVLGCSRHLGTNE